MKKRISYSELQSLDCWRKHHYRYALRLQPVQTFAALHFGKCFDESLNVYHEGNLFDLSEAINAGLEAINKDALRVDALLLERDIPRPVTWNEDIEKMKTLLVEMMKHYDFKYGETDLREWEVLDVQKHVVVKLPSSTGGVSNKYEFHGYVDRIQKNRRTGEVYIVDAKTTAGISDDYKSGFDTDWQLPLYAWALREEGYRIDGVIIDAVAKIIPAIPMMRQTPITVLDDQGEPIMDQVLDDAGNPVYFKSGKNKGEPKLKKRTRQGLRSMLSESGSLNYTTTATLMREAIQQNGLDESDYSRELEILDGWDNGTIDSPYFWRSEILFNDLQLQEAVESVRSVAPFAAGKLPNVKMPSKMKCKRCEFKEVCAARPDDREGLIAEKFTTPLARQLRKANQTKSPEPALPF